MNLVKLFGIACGMVFGASLVLLFNRSVREKIAARFPWCAAHPRAYAAVVTIIGLTVVLILYLVTVRFA